jgi:hypothetical protein
MPELRSAPRSRNTERGVAILKDGVRIDCTVHDVSESGARVGFRSRIILPKTFRLWLEKSGQEVGVTVMWQKSTIAGLRFATRLPQLKPKRVSLLARLTGRAT